MPPRTDLSRGTPTIGPLAPRPVRVKPIEDTIRTNVETDVRKQLGLTGTLPAEVREIIATAATTAASASVELAVARATEQVAADIGRKNVLDRFDDKIKVAADSKVHISQSNEVDVVLRRRSELLAKKR